MSGVCKRLTRKKPGKICAEINNDTERQGSSINIAS